MDKPDYPDDEPMASSGGLNGRHLIIIALVAIAIGVLVIYYVQEERRGAAPTPNTSRRSVRSTET